MPAGLDTAPLSQAVDSPLPRESHPVIGITTSVPNRNGRPARASTIGGPPFSAQDSHDTSALSVAFLDPATDPQYDRYVANHPQGTLFHQTAWRNAVIAAFEHEPFYLIARRRNIVGVLPLFQLPGSFRGRTLISVPYAVGGGILADGPVERDALLNAARKLALELRCQRIDFRSEHPALPDAPVTGGYVGFRRQLPGCPEDLLNWLPRKARAVVRKAREKHRLTVRFGDEHLQTVWHLYARNMRRLASLTYPFSFFSALLAQTPDAHWTSIVEQDGHPIAGLVTFLHGETVLPYFFGAENRARRVGAANLMYYQVMHRAVVEGFRIFDFGRSRLDNLGSVDFKRFQGFQPHPLGYQVLSLTGRSQQPPSPSDPLFRCARRIWPKLPLTLTTALSRTLSRRFPG